jgi:hypothetical protein
VTDGTPQLSEGVLFQVLRNGILAFRPGHIP